jgi:hypothetical protein
MGCRGRLRHCASLRENNASRIAAVPRRASQLVSERLCRYLLDYFTFGGQVCVCRYPGLETKLGRSKIYRSGSKVCAI